MNRKAWLKWSVLLLGGGSLFHSFGGGSGCLGDFWGGFWNTGWPTNNRWINVALDVLNEELFS